MMRMINLFTLTMILLFSPISRISRSPLLISNTNTSMAAQQKGGGDAQDLAQKLSNPVASLISVPFQNNFDFGLGPNEDGFRYTMNFQPVIPISLNKDWNLISRTIVPFIHQDNVIGRSSQTGLGDIVQSFFSRRTRPNRSSGAPVLSF